MLSRRGDTKICEHCGNKAGRNWWCCDPCFEIHTPEHIKRGVAKRKALRLARFGAPLGVLRNPAEKEWIFYTHRCVSRAIKAGLLPELDGLSCVDCGDKAKAYDHRDYSRPLEVDPVCVSCNAKRGPGAMPQPRIFAAYIELSAAA